jgi:predicted permease
MGLMRSLRFALRTLRKSPAFSVTTVILVGLGVGAVTTIFTLVDHVLLRGLPYPDAHRLVVLEEGAYSGVSFRELEDMRSVERWSAATADYANLVEQGDPLRIMEVRVSRDFFALFGARPALGRLLVEDDFAAADNVVLTHSTWERVFGGDPDIVGKSIRVDQSALTVVGVLDASFVVPEGMVNRSGRADIWRPLDWADPRLASVEYHLLEVAGRMASGVTLVDVQAELDDVAARMAQRFPDDMVGRNGSPRDMPAAGMHEVTTRRVRTGLGLLLGAVGLLLAVACMNVAHLFLARGLARVREMAVRRALGAHTVSLVGQLVVESLVLGLAGGAVGLGLATLGVRGFLTLNPTVLPWSTEVGVDVRVLLFAGAVSGATALAFGLLPALRSVRHDLAEELKGTSRQATAGRSASRLRSGLVVAEVATSLVLVTQAGLLLKSFMNVHAVEPGFATENIWTLPLTPTGHEEPTDYVVAMKRIEEALAAVPAVASAGFGLTQPFEVTGTRRCCWATRSIRADGEERDVRLWLFPVSRGYFETLSMPMVAGGVWSEGEATGEPWPVVLNESFAVALYGSAERALSQVAEVGGAATPVRIVGVTTDQHHYGLDQDAPTSLYMPMEHLPFSIPMAHMAVRLRAEAPPGLAAELRAAVWEASPELPVPTVRSMDEWIERSSASLRFDSVLFGSFGVLALFLAAAGLCGTLLYTVGQQRGELGIRMALGAHRGQVERRVVGRGLGLAVLGAVLGLAGTWGVARFLESRLFDMGAMDPPTVAAAVAVLLAAATLASWIPARRAGRTDPMQTLKAE